MRPEPSSSRPSQVNSSASLQTVFAYAHARATQSLPRSETVVRNVVGLDTSIPGASDPIDMLMAQLSNTAQQAEQAPRRIERTNTAALDTLGKDFSTDRENFTLKTIHILATQPSTSENSTRIPEDPNSDGIKNPSITFFHERRSQNNH